MIRALALAALLLLGACGREAALDRLATGEEGRVAEVVSGHYLELDSGLGVRVVGIVAPKADEPYGAEAVALTRRLVDGREVKLLYGGRRRDAYDRALAHAKVKATGVWLQKALLEAGAARVKSWPDNRALIGEMLEAEAKARNAGRGLWALEDYRVLIPSETADSDGFEIVEGRVRRVDDDARLIFDAGFSAEVMDKALADFETAGKPPGTLRGKLVRVRGLIRDGYGGAEMRLDHPEQVELLEEAG